MRTLLPLALAIDRATTRLARGVAWLLPALVLLGAYNAVARYFERQVGVRLSSNALLELQWYLFSIAFLLGAPYALRRGDHVRVDVFYGGLPARGRSWIDVWGGLLLLIPFCVFGAAISYGFVADSWVEGEVSNDPGGLPRWPFKPLVPLAFGLLALQGAAEVVKHLAVLRGVPPAAAGLGGQRPQQAADRSTGA